MVAGRRRARRVERTPERRALRKGRLVGGVRTGRGAGGLVRPETSAFLLVPGVVRRGGVRGGGGDVVPSRDVVVDWPPVKKTRRQSRIVSTEIKRISPRLRARLRAGRADVVVRCHLEVVIDAHRFRSQLRLGGWDRV